MNPASLLSLPLQVAIRATTATLRLATSAVDQVISHVTRDGSETPERPAEPQATAAPAQEAPPPEPKPPAPPRRPAPPPPRPAPPVHVSEEPVLVADSADPGAENGAGPEIGIAEPWEGYGRAPAAEIVQRIGGASAAEVAIVQLYEQVHRRRKSVLEAAGRRLTVLNDPATR